MNAAGQNSSRKRGAAAEAEARQYLEGQGYTVVTSNYTVRGGEVDVVAQEGDVLAFVEVKTRTSTRFGSGLHAVTGVKRARVAHAANRYLQAHPGEHLVRFDVLYRDGAQGWVLLRDAFRPEPA